MQNLLLTLALLFSSMLLAQTSNENNQFENGSEIVVSVMNATSDAGTIKFALYTEDTFMKAAPVKFEEATIENGKSTVVFKNVPVGEYAIICYHDVNENNQMDFQTNGMPQEDYGMSNNVMNFGPPQFDDAKFKVNNEQLSLEIKF